MTNSEERIDFNDFANKNLSQENIEELIKVFGKKIVDLLTPRTLNEWKNLCDSHLHHSK